MERNCLTCLLSEPTTTTMMFKDINGKEYNKCTHRNSPYFEEIVGEDTICRLYIDTNEYFLNKDRREKLENLKDSLRFPNK